MQVIDGYLRPLLANDWDRGTLMTYRSLQVGVPTLKHTPLGDRPARPGSSRR